MKRPFRKLLIPVLLLLLSIGFGLGFDAAATALERKKYPRPQRYAALIEEQAEAFGIPSPILWSMVCCESGFVSNALSEDGAVGLLQITPARMEQVYDEILREPIPDAGILYDPQTNLRVGAAMLSSLYQKYGVWNAVFAAWHAGSEAVDLWLADPDCLNGQGQLTNVPDTATAKFISEVETAAEMYTKLYFES